MISAARFPSLSTLFAAARALSSSGGSCASHRKQALALVTVAVMGWFISCARELANSPSITTRFMCASSASNWRSLSRSCSARLRSSISVSAPYHLRICPASSRSGTARTKNQRYSPSAARRKRTSFSYGFPVAEHARHSSICCSRSSGWTTFCQPNPAVSCSDRPV